MQANIVAGVVVILWWRDNRKRHQRSGDMFAITGCAILHVVVPGVVVGIAVVVVVIVACMRCACGVVWCVGSSKASFSHS